MMGDTGGLQPVLMSGGYWRVATSVDEWGILEGCNKC